MGKVNSEGKTFLEWMEEKMQVLQSDSDHVWAQGLATGDQVIVKGPGLLLAGTTVSVNVAELAGGEF